MMKRVVSVWLIGIMLLRAGLAAGEAPVLPAEDLPDAQEEADRQFLPQGIWQRLEGDRWMFITHSDAILTPAQMEVAQAAGLEMTGDVLQTGTLIDKETMLLLYPGAEEALGLPVITPDLEAFGLTGEWFYDEEDQLRYRHGDDYAVMTKEEVFAALGGATKANGEAKTIYLTIDDTPSHYTMEFLAELDRLNVKATFFVVGAYVKQRPVFMRAIYEEGHAIANHSYSHDATNLRSSFRNCLSDFQRCEEAVAAALGFELPMPILRIPYGASTIPVEFRTQLQKSGYLWIDWNALNGDTESAIKSDQDALDRAFDTAGRYSGDIVILVHDGKKRTIRTLEEMVNYFRGEGYTFGVLTPDMEKIPGVRMGLPQ